MCFLPRVSKLHSARNQCSVFKKFQSCTISVHGILPILFSFPHECHEWVFKRKQNPPFSSPREWVFTRKQNNFFFFFLPQEKIFKEKQDLGFTFFEFCFSNAFIRNTSDCHASFVFLLDCR